MSLYSRHSHSIQDMTSITEDFLIPRQKILSCCVKKNSRQKWTNQDLLAKIKFFLGYENRFSHQIFLATTFSLLRKYFTEGEIWRGLQGQCSLPSDTRLFSRMPEDSTVFQSSFMVTDSLHNGISQLDLAPLASSATDIFPAEIDETSPAPTPIASSESVMTENLPIPTTSSVNPVNKCSCFFLCDRYKQ